MRFTMWLFAIFFFVSCNVSCSQKEESNNPQTNALAPNADLVHQEG
jgi:preprotein translocase subunit SecG